jgi:hypothetical protein
MKFPRWELRHTADPLDTRAYGGGGDGGAGAMREQETERQRKVQSAVDAINAKFGVGPTSGTMEQVLGAAPTREQFTKAANPGGYYDEGENGPTRYVAPSGEAFDEGGYNQALAAFNAKKTSIYGEGDAGAAAAQAKTARDAMYADISGAVRDTAMRDLDRQYSQASKRNTFGLARAGLFGGSADAESGGELAELYGEGKLKATQAGMAAGADLRATDEKTRQNLISLAQSGIDTGTASSLAAGQMASAADVARGEAAGASVGRLFDDLSQAYVVNQLTKARTAGQQYTPTTGYGGFGTGRYTGTIQR